MRYGEYFQRVGLVAMLLVAGVVVGLMVPLPSEAQTVPVLKIQIDGTYNDNTADPAAPGFNQPLSNTGTVITSLGETPYNSTDCPAVNGYPSAATAANGNVGTKCYLLQTGQVLTAPNGRQYRVQAYSTPKPRLLVVEGGTNMDSITVSNLELAPVFPTGNTDWWGSTANNIGTCVNSTQTAPNCTTFNTRGEPHTFYLTLDHKFDRLPNNVNCAAGTAPTPPSCSTVYPFALRVSGMINGVQPGVAGVRAAGPTAGNGSSTFVKLVGDGYFTTSTTAFTKLRKTSSATTGPVCNYNASVSSTASDIAWCPMKRTLGSSTFPTSSFASGPAILQQDTASPSYPAYNCNNTGGATGLCKPRIVQLLKVTMYGPDSLQLANSWEGFGLGCNLTSPDPGGGPSGNPAIPCHSNGNKNAEKKMTEFADTITTTDLTTYMAVGADPTPACLVDCPCGDPAVCTGTIVAVADETPATDGLIFPYLGEGAGLLPSFRICSSGHYDGGTGTCILPNTNPPESETFKDVPISGGPWTITYDRPNAPRVDANTFWDPDNIECTSVLNNPNVIPPIIVSTWKVDVGGIKTKAEVTKLGKGDTVTCTWHIHKNSGSQ